MLERLIRYTCIVTLAACATACGDDNGVVGDDDDDDTADASVGDDARPPADGGPPGDAMTAQLCAVSVSARGSYSCAIGEDGAAFCWGRNHRGQLGNGGTSDSTVPVAVALPAAVTVDELATGAVHACALDDGRVYCWGSRTSGQVGDGSIGDTAVTVPALVPDLDDVVTIASGGFHTCAIRADDSLWCWGDNVAGQIGDATLDDRPSPVQVASGIAQVTAGEEHTCVVTLAGGVECWGRNDEGALGDGTRTSRTTAVTTLRVGGAALTGVEEIAAGLFHTCARTATQVLCWGANATGQVEAAPGPDRLVAMPVGGLAAVAALTAGELHTCAVTAAGGVMCWGHNASGQLGQGDIQQYNQPIEVPLPGEVAALAAGDLHTCAVTDREVWCWGYNAFGQLGDGSLRQSTLPVPATLECR